MSFNRYDCKGVMHRNPWSGLGSQNHTIPSTFFQPSHLRHRQSNEAHKLVGTFYQSWLLFINDGKGGCPIILLCALAAPVQLDPSTSIPPTGMHAMCCSIILSPKNLQSLLSPPSITVGRGWLLPWIASFLLAAGRPLSSQHCQPIVVIQLPFSNCCCWIAVIVFLKFSTSLTSSSTFSSPSLPLFLLLLFLTTSWQSSSSLSAWLLLMLSSSHQHQLCCPPKLLSNI